MKERLIQFLAYLGIGQLKFEEKIGVSRGYVNKIGENITVKTLDKIESHYPNLNISWLKTGEGSMLKDDPNSTMIRGNYNNVGHNNTIGSNNLASEPSVYYAMNQDQIKLMELEIESLKKQLEDKDRIIAAKDQTLKLYEKMLDK